MDSNPNQKRGRGVNKQYWSTEEDEALMLSLQELYANPKWRADTSGFKNGYLLQLEGMMQAKIRDCRMKASPHIESRLKTLKQKFNALNELLSLSGFAWNEEKMMLVCEKSVYDEWVKKRSDASGLYGKPFPYYNVLGEIYGRDRAVGANAGNADDDEEEVRQEDAVSQHDLNLEEEYLENMINEGIGSRFGGLEDLGASFTQPNTHPFASFSAQPNAHPFAASSTQPNAHPFAASSSTQPSGRHFSASTQPNAQQKRTTPGNVSNDPRKKSKVMDDISKSFSHLAESVAGMAPQLDGLVKALSTDMELTDLQGQLNGQLSKMAFLTPLQAFQVTNYLAKQHDLLRVFFTMSDEKKEDYVRILLQHGGLLGDPGLRV